MERARDRLPPGASVAVARVEVGRQRRPARRPQQRVEVVRGHRAAGVRRVRQGVRFEQMATRLGLELPQEAFLGRRVIVGVLQVDEVEAPCLAIEGLDRRDHAAPVADGGEHAGAGNGGVSRRGGHELLRGRRRRGIPPSRIEPDRGLCNKRRPVNHLRPSMGHGGTAVRDRSVPYRLAVAIPCRRLAVAGPAAESGSVMDA